MTAVARAASFSSSTSVNRRLVRLFFVLWLVVAFHGVVLRRHELWPLGAVAIGIGLVPPVLPIVVTMWGQLATGTGVYSWLVTVLAACAWVAAARHPQSSFLLFLARAALVVYWLTLSFLVAMGT